MEACFNLGVIYADRLGEDSSLFDAEFWYKSAAAGGHRFAQLALAKLYARHYRNKEAAHWFLIVAKQGVPVAQEEVAKMYLEGTGLPQNEIEALAWAILAAAGSKMCAEQLDQMQMMDGYEDIKMQAQARALELSKDMPAPE
jgi:TPR repeat protein